MHAPIKAGFLAFAAVLFLQLPAQAQQQGRRLAACRADVEKFCASVPRGQGKVRACLEENKDKVSSDCRSALENVGH
ncbi:MAG TPA: cysteine rich repeat-containing protein [Hyphomicrobiales bacterium]|nr:cysteine rich repeat-containing protein [Hyphomicrobiales bacterium]